jgi:hypothetical protein
MRQGSDGNVLFGIYLTCIQLGKYNLEITCLGKGKVSLQRTLCPHPLTAGFC